MQAFGIGTPVKTKLKTCYSMIPDKKIKNDEIFSATCKEGDLLFCDVRILHRDSPLKEGMRISLHCYLGDDPNSKPKIKLD